MTPTHFEYTVEAVEGPVEGSWVEYFRAITRAANEATLLDADTTILKLVGPFTDTIEHGEQVTVTKVACPLPSTTLHPSNTLYPC